MMGPQRLRRRHEAGQHLRTDGSCTILLATAHAHRQRSLLHTSPGGRMTWMMSWARLWMWTQWTSYLCGRQLNIQRLLQCVNKTKKHASFSGEFLPCFWYLVTAVQSKCLYACTPMHMFPWLILGHPRVLFTNETCRLHTQWWCHITLRWLEVKWPLTLVIGMCEHLKTLEVLKWW